MPSGVVAGYFDYPGLAPLISGQYTCSHGVSPGTVVLRTQPAAVGPLPGGDVEIGDGRKSCVIPRCKLIRFTQERSDSGVEWMIELEDGRWRWRDGKIDGVYNQLDTHGKLIPRSIRSPTEMAILCIQAMGMARYVVDMPDGIPATAFINTIPDFLPAGINFPPTGINPPVNWYAENPAGALNALAEVCGRRVIYDHVQDRVLVLRPGLGGDLPGGSVANISPSMVAPDTPDAVQVVGDPTRYEAMFELYAVGLEWNGQIVPIDRLSYAPIIAGVKHTVELKVEALNEGTVYGLSVEFPGGVTASYAYKAVGPDDVPGVLLELQLKIKADPNVAPLVTVVKADALGTLTLTAVKAGPVFDVTNDCPARQAVVVKRSGAADTRGWDFSAPPSFGNVVPTPRLTRVQALNLAQKSVWRMYRITGRDASTLAPPVAVPGYGKAQRQDIVLLDELVEQIVPEAGDPRFAGKGEFDINKKDLNGDAFQRSLYDGYSRSKPPEVYGSVALQCASGGNAWFIGDGLAAKGAAALAKPPDPVKQVYSFQIKAVTASVVYALHLIADGVDTAFAYFALPGDTVAIIAAAFNTQIGATGAPSLAGKLALQLTADAVIVSSAVAGFLFAAEDTTATAGLTFLSELVAGVPVTDPPPTGAVPAASASASGGVDAAGGVDDPKRAKGDSLNTDPGDRVYIDFSVDPTWQMITFSAPVYANGAGCRLTEPTLFLRCACNVKDRFTQQVAAYTDTNILRPGPAVRIVKRPDVQLNVLGKYKLVKIKGAVPAVAGQKPIVWAWQLVNTDLLEADAIIRARYYLIAELVQYQVKGGVTVEYNGIEPVGLDGAISQVTYSVQGGSGTMTTVSRNMEHSTWLPPFPRRRRAENLDAVARAAVGGGRKANPGDGNAGSQNPGAAG